MVDLLNTIILIMFTAGLFATTLSIGRRLLDYRKAGLHPPLLAKRDIILLAGLAIPFLLILGVRGLGLAEQVQGQIWWSLLTGLPAIVGVFQFAYIEFFIIEKRDSLGYLKYLKEAVEEQEEKLETEYSEMRKDKIGSS